MTAFLDWLGQIGLAHCGPALGAEGIDFERAAHLREDEMCRLGMNADDIRTFVHALASRELPSAPPLPEFPTVASPALRPVLASSGERRQQLTVMFCDLVGYTGLCQRLDPEDLRDIRQAFITVCSESVKNYGGHIAQDPGDALIIYFGWPSAHEDDPERCVRSALEIVDAVRKVRTSEPLAAHIGIATGDVVVGGAPGAGGAVGLAYGEPPTVAARLQGIAKAHEVLIAASTRRLLGDVFELADLGTRELKGYMPSRVWRAEGVRRTADRSDAAHGGVPLTALVGREEELELLLGGWNSARNATGRTVLIAGEAGIGKSRLTQALRERIEGDNHSTLRYQCSPFHGSAALYPVITQIELASGFAREDSAEQKLDKLEKILVGRQAQRAEAAPLLATLLALPTARYSDPGLSPQKRKERTLAVLLGQIEALSQIKPILMILEDAHWIDPTSQELLNALVPRLRTLHIMLVLTFRPKDYTPPAKWVQSGQATAMMLTGLTNRQSAQLADNVAKGKALPAEVVEKLVAQADGVPLYIEELTKSVLESRLLIEEADRYALLEPLNALAIPDTLNASLIARLDRREGVRELAQIGACIGRVFSYELLAAVSGMNGQEFDHELEQLTDTELVFRQGTPPDATYTFKHALVRDAAYDSLLKSRKQQLHAQIADVLEQKFPRSTMSTPELLAHHRTEAGQLVAAIPLWRRAGEAALARVALRESVAYLEKGLAIVDRLVPSAERDSLELSLREPLHSARLRLFGWAADQVRANAEAILWLAQKAGRPQSLLIGLWGIWINTITQGRVAETRDWARRLLMEGDERGIVDLQIFGHRALLSTHFYLGELQEALEEQHKILRLYDPQQAARWMELTGNDTKTAVGIFASQTLWMSGKPEEAAELCNQKDSDSRQLGNPWDIGWALTWGAYVFDYLCQPDQLMARATEAERLGREQSIPVISRVLVPMIVGLASLRNGHLVEAVSSLQSAIDAWGLGGGGLNRPYLKAAMAEAMARRGGLDASLHLLDECLEQIERPGWGERVWLAETLRLKGWVLMRQHKRAEAEAQLRASIEWARRQKARSWELRSSTTLAQLLIEGGRRDAARELLAPIYNWFTEGFDTHDLKVARSLLDDLR
jgi:class 3 adenylate cyclase/tetratricopeptide (TPR) repeat protein